MLRSLLLATLLAMGVAGAGAARAAPAGGPDCERLAITAFPGARDVRAQASRAGPVTFTAADGSTWQRALPAFCRVTGVSGLAIGFEVWLPSQGWNHRFLSLGNGGFGGDIPTRAMADALVKGYAVTANDTGHRGGDLVWMRNRVQVRNWGHDATHLTTGPAKAIVSAFYGQPARYAYFAGCSTGGAQAMEEAEFYPQDYDGVIAGAPAMSYAHVMLSFLWGLKVSEAPGARIAPDRLEALNRAVLAACDGLDGVKDGLVSEPQACRFDPRALICKPGQASGCLSSAQAEAARLIYQGPRGPRSGEAIFPGLAYGSETFPGNTGADPFGYGWAGVQGPLAQIFALPLLREMVLRDPQWDWRRFDWDHDVAVVDHIIGPDITAVSPDLSAFRARGGKLIMYQGWGDTLIAPGYPILYRRQVIEQVARGGDKAAEQAVDGFFRLFMAPGMGHCAGGVGPSQFDALPALQAWVETKTAPERLIATRPGALGQPALERPLCPYPKVARWDGRGPAASAASFRCAAPSPARNRASGA